VRHGQREHHNTRLGVILFYYYVSDIFVLIHGRREDTK